MLGTGVTVFRYVPGSVLRNRRGYWLPARKVWLRIDCGRILIGLVHRPHIGYAVVALWDRCGRLIREVPLPDRKRPRMKKVTLVKPEEEKLVHLAAPENTVWAKTLHPLVSWLITTKYEDGTARLPGEFRLRTKGRSWECQLIDYDARAHVRLASSTLDDLMAMVCLGLETEDLPWELADWLPGPKKKK